VRPDVKGGLSFLERRKKGEWGRVPVVNPKDLGRYKQIWRRTNLEKGDEKGLKGRDERIGECKTSLLAEELSAI